MLLRVTPAARPFTGGLASSVKMTVPELLVPELLALRVAELRGTVLDVYGALSADVLDAVSLLLWNETKFIWSLLAAATILCQSSSMAFSSDRRLVVNILLADMDDITSGGTETSGVVSTKASVDW